MGPSGIVVEMIRAASDMGASMICDLAAAIIHNGKVPSGWEQSFIVCLYKGKRDVLERGNYHGLKLTEQVMKVLERIVDGLIRQLVSIDDSQFGFIPGRGTTDAIFVVRQLQEKYLAANKGLYVFRRPGKGFWSSTSEGHLVGTEITWCGGVDCVTGAGDVCKCSELCPCWWGVQWRVWSEGQCSPGLSTQPASLHPCAWSLITRVPLWGPLGGSLCWWPCYHCWIPQGMCQEALDLERSNGKERTESKCRKDKDHDMQYGPGPPAEFRWVSMRCLSHWSGRQQHLLQQLQALGAQEMQWAQALDKGPWLQMCQGTAHPLDGRPQREVKVGPDKLAVVSSFCYLGDMLSAAGAVNFQPQHMWKPPGRSSRSCYQFSLHATSLSRHVAVCTALVCGAQCSMPVRLGHWQNQRSNICSGMTGQWSDKSATSGWKTLSQPGPMSYLRSLALRIWTSFWRREASAGMDMWNTLMVQSR